MAEKEIPKPDATIVQQWIKGTRDKKLVYSVSKDKWIIVNSDKMVSGDVAYEEYQQGKTKIGKPSPYSPPLDAEGNPVVPGIAGMARYQAAINPLKPYIDSQGLLVTTDPERDGETYLAGKEGKRYYLYFDSNNKLTLDSDYDKVKKAAIDDLKSSNQLNSLFDELYRRKVIGESTYKTKSTTSNDFNAALKDIIAEYSKSVIALNQPNQDPQKFMEFALGIMPSSGVNESDLPRREFQDISREQLGAFIDKIYLETIGKKPDEEQRKAKLKELNKIVKEGVVTTKKVVGGEVQYRTKGGFNEEQQGLLLQEQLKTENPLEYERRQAFGFMDSLQKILSGGL